jgi:hypothetical protein
VMNCVERFFDATEVVAQSFPQGNQTWSIVKCIINR